MPETNKACIQKTLKNDIHNAYFSFYGIPPTKNEVEKIIECFLKKSEKEETLTQEQIMDFIKKI